MTSGQPTGKVTPVPRVVDAAKYEGLWIAVLDGKVVAAEETSHKLALKLHEMDHRKRGLVVTEFVRPTGDVFIVGAG